MNNTANTQEDMNTMSLLCYCVQQVLFPQLDNRAKLLNTVIKHTM